MKSTLETNTISLYLSLIKLGIEHDVGKMPINCNWQEIQDLAARHGLGAVVLDGIEKLPEGQRPPKVFLLEWIGETLQGYEYRYEMYSRAIAEMATFYREHGFKMMVLKGYACSIDWPKPEHRPCGDIDIWLFGKQKEADALLGKEKSLEIDTSHHHHTVFYWRDFMVENHYDFVNVHAHKSNKELEKVLKSLGMDDTHTEEVIGEKIYLPSANLHALFLTSHLATHFASSEISLRQVLDWSFFVKAHYNEVDWAWLNGELEKFHLMDFVSCINAICVEDLGFEAGIFNGVHFNPSLKDKVLRDIINPAFGVEEPIRLFPRLIYKYKRWQGNAWKQELCYSESRWSAFWTSIWNHLLKPASI